MAGQVMCASECHLCTARARVRCCDPTAVIRAGCCGFGVYSGVQVSAKLRPSDVLPPFLHESLFSLRPERYDLREVANTARSPASHGS